jgi:hypothetical protein
MGEFAPEVVDSQCTFLLEVFPATRALFAGQSHQHHHSKVLVL